VSLGLVFKRQKKISYMQMRLVDINQAANSEILWREIPGYEGLYAACHYGFVMNLKTKKVLHNQVFKSGYVYATLCKNGKKKNRSLHRIIAMTFIPNPESKAEVNHKNGNKLDNHFALLEWSTPSENKKHAFATGLMKVKKPQLGRTNEKSIHSKPVDQYDLQGNLIKQWPSIAEAQRNGFTVANICKVCKGERPTHKGFIWKYSTN
jgi:hypothetical protein